VVSFGRVGAGSAEALVVWPARIFGGTGCYLFPKIEAPRDLVVYFYEGNDIEDNHRFLANVAKQYGDTSDASIDRFLVGNYGTAPPWWKCHTYLADTAVRMAKFLFLHHLQDGTLDLNPPRKNELIVAGERVSAPSVPGPGLQYGEDQTRTAMRVLDRSLRWLKDRFPDVPTTVVYIPSQASTYRFATDVVVTSQGRHPSLSASVAQIAKRSDLICDLARAAALSHEAAFIDARPALRRAAETLVLHGPIDWVHFNEAGYRILGKLVVQQATAQH
jgi:lysophospholipase L1-like esterase